MKMKLVEFVQSHHVKMLFYFINAEEVATNVEMAATPGTSLTLATDDFLHPVA